MGNQACVVLMDDLSDTNRLHQIAKDFNLPATTFLKKRSDGYDVRWFAPDSEIGLCGHGTVAATWILGLEQTHSKAISFFYGQGNCISGNRKADVVTIQAEAIPYERTDIPLHVVRGFHGKAIEYYTSPNKHIVLLDSEDSVRLMRPNWEVLRSSDTFGYVVTAKGLDADCVSRVLLPYVSFLEDQATGSAHMLLTPFWCDRLGKSRLKAFQASARGGAMQLELLPSGKIEIGAHCLTFANGKLL